MLVFSHLDPIFCVPFLGVGLDDCEEKPVDIRAYQAAQNARECVTLLKERNAYKPTITQDEYIQEGYTAPEPNC